MNRIVLIGDIPHGAGGHVLLVSSLDGVTESYLAPRLRDARMVERWCGPDAIAVSRLTVQRAAGIESNRTAAEVLLLIGAGTATLNAAQIDEVYRKLELRLPDLTALATSEPIDRRGSLHLCPQLTGWILTDEYTPDFAATRRPGMTKSTPAARAIDSPSTRTRPLEATGAIPPPRPKSSVRRIKIIGIVIAVVASGCWLFQDQIASWQARLGPSTSQISSAENQLEAGTASNLVGRNLTGSIPATPASPAGQMDPLKAARVAWKALDWEKLPWSEAAQEFFEFADQELAYKLEGADTNEAEKLRGEFSKALFFSAERELKAISNVNVERVEDLRKQGKLVGSEMIGTLISDQGQRVSGVLAFFEQHRQQLQKCVPRDQGSEYWTDHLQIIARRAVSVHYELVYDLVRSTLLGKTDLPPDITIVPLAGAQDVSRSLSHFSDKQQSTEMLNTEQEFRRKAKLTDTNPLLRLANLKSFSFTVSTIPNSRFQMLSTKLAGQPETSTVRLSASDSKDRPTEQLNTLLGLAEREDSMTLTIPTSTIETVSQAAPLRMEVDGRFEVDGPLREIFRRRRDTFVGTFNSQAELLNLRESGTRLLLDFPTQFDKHEEVLVSEVVVKLSQRDKDQLNEARKWRDNLRLQLDEIKPANASEK